MTQPHTTELLSSHPSGGCRVASDRYRLTLADCHEFGGLEEGADRYQLLLLVKKLGKAAGFTPRMIQLLDYYMAFTRDQDWEQGSRPIVYQSLSRTALDLGVSERQIQKLEQALFTAGAISWSESGNYKRYGQRCPKTGRILYAFGVELTPLAALHAELEDKLQEKKLYDAAWMETKRQVSWYRAQIRATLQEGREQGRDESQIALFDRQYAEIAVPIRSHLDLQSLRALLQAHKSLYSEIVAAMGVDVGETKQTAQRPSLTRKTGIRSSRGEQKVAHYKSTTQESSDKSDTRSPSDNCFQESVAARQEPRTNREKRGGDGEVARHTSRSYTASSKPPSTNPQDLILATGLQHITLKHALQAASDRFRSHLPLTPRPLNWSDIVEAADSVRRELQIPQKIWGEACQLLTRPGAALCVLLTDLATQRVVNPVLRPTAYFRGIVGKATQRSLRLHGTILSRSRSRHHQ